MTAFARCAEACGYEAIYVVEHLIIPDAYESRYPYSPTGRMPLPAGVDVPDPLELLAFLAARTDRIRLGTGMLVLPVHLPVHLAKRLATLDRLSGGRVTVGVGVGWLKEELDLAGADWSGRGKLADEAIAELRRRWSTDDADVFPKPVQQPGPPIHIGGHSPAAARRAGRYGDGFQPLGVAGDDLARLVDIVNEHASGRTVELSLGGLLDELDDDRLLAADAAGADRLVLSTRDGDLAATCNLLEAVADRYLR